MRVNRWIKVSIFALLTLWASGGMATTEDEEAEKRWQAEIASYNEYINYVTEIEHLFADQMQRELNLDFADSGGTLHGKVKQMRMKFKANHRATIEEARALVLLAIERFVQAINAHEKIQPYLEERPFTYKRVQISIGFEGINRTYSDGSVSYVNNFPGDGTFPDDNYIFYRANDPFTDRFVYLFSEPYEEAVQRHIPVKNHEETEQENAMDQLLFSFRNAMEKKYSLECWSIGGKITHGIEEFSAKFFVERHATQEQARQLQVAVAQKLLEAINSDERLRPYLSDFPFSSNRIKMRICFRDKRYLPYRDGSIESVTLENNEITYFQQPPLLARGEVGTIEEAFAKAKEPYPEALKLVDSIPESKREIQPLSDTFRHIRDSFTSLLEALYEVTGVEVGAFVLSLILLGTH